MKPNPTKDFAALTADFIEGRLPADRANMAKMIIAGSLAILQAGRVMNKAADGAMASVTALLDAIRMAEADILAGRHDDALATLQRLIREADSNAATGQAAGSA